MTIENNRNQTRLIMLMNKQNHRKRIQKQHKINLLMQSILSLSKLSNLVKLSGYSHLTNNQKSLVQIPL